MQAMHLQLVLYRLGFRWLVFRHLRSTLTQFLGSWGAKCKVDLKPIQFPKSSVHPIFVRVRMKPKNPVSPLGVELIRTACVNHLRNETGGGSGFQFVVVIETPMSKVSPASGYGFSQSEILRLIAPYLVDPPNRAVPVANSKTSTIDVEISKQIEVHHDFALNDSDFSKLFISSAERSTVETGKKP